ncbi:hypothetical protein PFICI_02117 [Pestalotiopsis fici W106-1]|uniref:Uncharacterized protein n=1 Tax=Pestalotiopsis fici (strain W106-1 / CGMCC3.15140) TaxID=1229662 RepID=W3XF87_PESFW|nr:uncharacterized protein PFICI_02117 [Pestalotiopsis fici W106-1]ETS84092.1 hypothetical protein PFICI_02117 [Pestalotiopsis fici W106-1]
MKQLIARIREFDVDYEPLKDMFLWLVFPDQCHDRHGELERPDDLSERWARPIWPTVKAQIDRFRVKVQHGYLVNDEGEEVMDVTPVPLEDHRSSQIYDLVAYLQIENKSYDRIDTTNGTYRHPRYMTWEECQQVIPKIRTKVHTLDARIEDRPDEPEEVDSAGWRSHLLCGARTFCGEAHRTEIHRMLEHLEMHVRMAGTPPNYDACHDRDILILIPNTITDWTELKMRPAMPASTIGAMVCM